MTRTVDCKLSNLQPGRADASSFRLPDHFLREILEQAVLPVFMVGSADLWSCKRGRPRAAFARQVGMYLAHVACGLSLTEVGHIFSRDRTTVAHACALIEDLRDDPVLDRSLELLEAVLHSLTPSSATLSVRSRGSAHADSRHARS